MLIKEEVIDAIKLKSGILTHVADHLGVCRDTIYDYIKENEDVAQAVKEARNIAAKNNEQTKEECKDLIWHAYRSLLLGKDSASVIFGLKAMCNIKETQDHNVTFRKVDACDPSDH